MNYTKEYIVDCIHGAFSKEPVGNKPLTTLLGYGIEVSRNVECYLSGKTWEEIDWLFIHDRFLGDACDISGTLTIDAYKKIFPSLLLFCLSDVEARRTLIIDYFIQFQLNIDEGYNSDDRSVFFSSLSTEQARCVALVLNYAFLTDNDDEFKAALDSYWAIFLESDNI